MQIRNRERFSTLGKQKRKNTAKARFKTEDHLMKNKHFLFFGRGQFLLHF